MDAVSSHPKLPGIFCCERSLLKWSIQPRSLWLGKGFSRTPKYTSPSGPTVGVALLSSVMVASRPEDGSDKRTWFTTASVVLFRATKYPKPKSWLSTATYSVLPSLDSAGAQLVATLVIAGSPLIAAAETHVPVPFGAMRAIPLCKPIGVEPRTKNPKKRFP